MTSMRVRPSRCRGTGLLARPPLTTREHGVGWSELVVDPTQQLRSLVDLRERGLIDEEAFERFVARLALDVSAPDVSGIDVRRT
jgi:hypothetical protein